MKVQQCSLHDKVSFAARYRSSENGNVYPVSDTGKIVGGIAGVALGTGLVVAQMRTLKTFRGKKNLIYGINAKGKSLNDVFEKIVERDISGNVIPPQNGVSDRTKMIVKDFKKSLIGYGALIAAATTGFGAIADRNISLANAKEADDRASYSKLYR